MKRLTLLAVLCAFVLGMAASASAAEIKASGSWAVEAVWKANWQFGTDAKTNNVQTFNVKQRATTSFEFIANENLKGVMQLRYGTESWGRKSFAIGMGDSGDNNFDDNRMTVRQAYLDFNWPGTQQNIVAGYKSVSLPAMFGGGSYILDEEIATAMVNGPITDNVSYLVGYARAFQGTDETEAGKLDQVDGYYAALPLSFEGFDIVPFGMYANIGENVTAGQVATSKMAGLAAVSATTGTGDSDFDNAWWLGLGFKMDLFDPFVFKADLNYGTVDADDDYNKRAGWLFDAALEYKGFDFMTPEVFFAYTSGEDEADSATSYGKSHRMPVLAASNWAVGSFFIGGDTLLDGSINNRNASLGFWTLGVSFKDIASFLDGMSHTVHVLYMQGTNDKDLATFAGATKRNATYGRTLTEDDSLWEVDVNTAYKVYDELTLTLDLGYINMDATNKWGVKDNGGDAWKVSTGVLYQF